jgi:hypothetical protein
MPVPSSYGQPRGNDGNIWENMGENIGKYGKLWEKMGN